MTQPAGVVLPKLTWRESPNVSDRRHGIKPYLIVLHRPVGSFASALGTLTNPAAEVSAHALIGRPAKGGPVELYQLVEWHRKSWTSASFNSPSYNLEVDDNAWLSDKARRDAEVFNMTARVAAFLCTKTGIPPRWSRDPLRTPGVIRHFDLGAAGGSHTDPTLDVALWESFIRRVAFEFRRGGFRKSYGKGRLVRL